MQNLWATGVLEAMKLSYGANLSAHTMLTVQCKAYVFGGCKQAFLKRESEPFKQRRTLHTAMSSQDATLVTLQRRAGQKETSFES